MSDEVGGDRFALEERVDDLLLRVARPLAFAIRAGRSPADTDLRHVQVSPPRSASWSASIARVVADFIDGELISPEVESRFLDTVRACAAAQEPPPSLVEHADVLALSRSFGWKVRSTGESDATFASQRVTVKVIAVEQLHDAIRIQLVATRDPSVDPSRAAAAEAAFPTVRLDDGCSKFTLVDTQVSGEHRPDGSSLVRASLTWAPAPREGSTRIVFGPAGMSKKPLPAVGRDDAIAALVAYWERARDDSWPHGMDERDLWLSAVTHLRERSFLDHDSSRVWIQRISAAGSGGWRGTQIQGTAGLAGRQLAATAGHLDLANDLGLAVPSVSDTPTWTPLGVMPVDQSHSGLHISCIAVHADRMVAAWSYVSDGRRSGVLDPSQVVLVAGGRRVDRPDGEILDLAAKQSSGWWEFRVPGCTDPNDVRLEFPFCVFAPRDFSAW